MFPLYQIHNITRNALSFVKLGWDKIIDATLKIVMKDGNNSSFAVQSKKYTFRSFKRNIGDPYILKDNCFQSN